MVLRGMGVYMTTDGFVNDGGDAGFEVAPFQGEKALTGALERCIIDACEQGVNTLCFCDVDFAWWPLSNERVIEAMTGWARSASNQRRLTVVAATYSMIEREHGVWKRWRRNWNHRVQCLQIEPEFDANLPCVFWSEKLMLTVQNRETCVWGVSLDKQGLVVMRQRLEELKKCCVEAFPATTLGL